MIKRNIILAVLMIVCLNTYSQAFIHRLDSTKHFHTIYSDTFPGLLPDVNSISGPITQFQIHHYNKLPNINLREGMEDCGIHYEVPQIVLSGNLLAGKRIGKWEYIIWKPQTSFKGIIEYKTDTIIHKPAWPFGRELIYIKDSTEVYGRINTYKHPGKSSGIVIHFNCIKNSGCIYRTPDNEIITKSKFEDLENTLYNLEGGLYNMEIKKLIE